MIPGEANGRLALGLLVAVGLLMALAILAPGCGARSGRHLSLEELRTLEACVIAADDPVERQNCVERLLPVDR